MSTKRSTKRSMLAALSLSLAGVAVPGGCGNLGPEDGSETLETLSGSVTNSQSLSFKGQLRVALIWSGAVEQTTPGGDTETSPFNVAQDIPVAPQFPATFALPITAPPPEAVMLDKDSSFVKDEEDFKGWPAKARMAFGTLVVYEDGNGNGQLDLLGPTATLSADTLVGARRDLTLIYFEGELPTPLVQQINSWAAKEDGQPKLGFNLLETNLCSMNAKPDCVESVKWYKPGEVFDLPLSLDPGLSSLICQTPDNSGSGSGQIVDMGTQQPTTYPDPADVTCAEGGEAYTTDECKVLPKKALCDPTVMECVSRTWHVPDPTAPPSGWPCTITTP